METFDIATALLPVFVAVTVLVRNRKNRTVPQEILLGLIANWSGGRLTVIAHPAVVVPEASPEESATCPLKLYVPTLLGVPAMAPVAASRVRPGGKLPLEIENIRGDTPPEAVSAELYGAPRGAAARGQDSVSGTTY